MSELKTKASDASVEAFLKSIEHPVRKADGLKILQIFQEETSERPVMWGPAMVGFGTMTYSNAAGKEMVWFPVGFSPRKQSLSIYIMLDHAKLVPFLSKLGKHKKAKGCLYINKLADIDEKIFREMIRTSINLIRTKNQ